MSSAYLTSKDMARIERVLAEAREPSESRSFDRETAQALMLIRAVERGVRTEADLRLLLEEHIALHRKIDYPLAEWENEGGAVRQ